MRFRILDLRAFGCFTDRVLDFGDPAPRIELIHGPNEAGKSTALRAIRQVLHGIPLQTSDDFRHGYRQLRLGADLERADGSRLAFVRRKASKAPLKGPDDQVSLDESALERFLDGLDAQVFATMFAIDHGALVQGGQEILAGRGDIGRILFDAGAGLKGLRETQIALRTELDGLFRPNGRNQEINRTLLELKELRQQVQAAQVPPDLWETRRRALAEARQLHEAVKAERQAEAGRLARITRILDALPALAIRRQILADLEPLGDVGLIDPARVEQRQSSRRTLDLESERLGDTLQELERIELRLQALAGPGPLLEQAEAIEAVFQELGSLRKARADQPKLLATCQKVEHIVKNKLKDLGREPELDRVEELRVPAAGRSRIRELGAQEQALHRDRAQARETVAALEHGIRELENALAGEDPPRDVAGIEDLVRRGRAVAGREAELDRIEEELPTMVARLEELRGVLALDGPSLEDLACARVPSPEAVDHQEELRRELDGRVGRLEEARRVEEEALGELDATLRALSLESAVPTEEDLTVSRDRREKAWRLVRRRWIEGESREILSGGPDPDPGSGVGAAGGGEGVGTGVLPGPVPDDELARAYEAAVQRADAVADRLRREAERVARRARAQADREHRGRTLERRIGEIEEARGELARWSEGWEALWTDSRVEPGSPREMRGWLRRHQELVALHRETRRLRARQDLLEAEIDAVRTPLAGALARPGPGSGPADRLGLLLERASTVVDREQARARDRERRLTELARSRSDLAGARRRVDAVEEELARWKDGWSETLREAGLEPRLTAMQAGERLDLIGEILKDAEEADVLRRRLKGMERDAREFASRVGDLCRPVATDLGAIDPVAAATELHARVGRARQEDAERGTLRTRQEELTRTRRACEASLAEARADLDQRCRDLGVDGHDALPEIERRAGAKAELLGRLHQVEETLASLSGGASPDEFAATAHDHDPDQLGAERDRTTGRIRELEAELDRLSHEIGACDGELRRIDGSSRAADLAAQAAGLTARLDVLTRRYVELKLADSILRQAIERYRTRNQGPILDRAGELFRRLTGSSFAGLAVDFDDSGEPVLKGRRADPGTPIEVAAMSDGTRDQLYLALRVASLETYLTNREPVPFIVDDVLLNFDDHRAAAALEVLADLSSWTQVIYFTHHRHHRDLARTVLPPERLQVHELPVPGVTRPGPADRPDG